MNPNPSPQVVRELERLERVWTQVKADHPEAWIVDFYLWALGLRPWPQAWVAGRQLQRRTKHKRRAA